MLVLNFVLLAALGASTFFFIEYVGPEKDVRWSHRRIDDDGLCVSRETSLFVLIPTARIVFAPTRRATQATPIRWV